MEPDAATPELVLPDDVATLQAMIRELLAVNHKQGRELDSLRQRLDQLLRRLYGPKSEQFRPDQPGLFDELTPPEPPPAEEPAASAAPERKPRRRHKHGRRKLPADLPRERKVHDLPEADKTCRCCQQPLVPIGEEVSEQLDFQPAKLFVWQHVRLKYACPGCLASAGTTNAAGGAETPVSPAVAAVADAASAPATPAVETPSIADLIVTAPKPAQPIDKGLPGPGLLAHIVTSKYADHLPLNRQTGILARSGVDISRSTLCDWVAAVAALLRPLYGVMLAAVLRSRVVHLDETRLPVLEKQQHQVKSGRLWTYIGDRNQLLIVYDYRPDKSRAGPAEILKDYRGFLQADAANVFDGLYLPGGIVEVGCNAHARRYFFDAQTSDAARSATALAYYRRLYDVEDTAKEEIARLGLNGEAGDAVRFRLRQEQSVAILTQFRTWLVEQQAQVLPKSPMGQAIAYTLRHWQALMRFTEHGFLDIDNNEAERSFRAVALGRHNYLFVGSDNGGQTAAVLYSFAQTCKLHGIDPFVYLRDVLALLPTFPAERLEELLPPHWAQAQRAAIDTPPTPPS